MPRSFWKICFVLLIAAGFFIGAGETRALSLAPALIEVEAEPGELLVQKITFFNETDQLLTIYPRTENFKPQKESPAPQFLGDTDLFGAARWIIPPVKKMILKSGERTEILLKIKIPDAAEPGGHYAALLWSEKPAEDVGIGTASRVGTLFLFKIKGDAKEDAKIISFQNTFKNQSVDFVLRLQNDGNAHLKPGGTIKIMNWLGKTVAKLSVNPKGQSILPQSQRNFTVFWENNDALPGWYSARADVSYGVSAKTLSARVNFWFWPTGFGNKILGIILVLLLGGVIFKMARRRARGLTVIILLACFLALPVLASTTSTGGTTDVSASVPTQSSSGGSGGGGGGGDAPPAPPEPPVPPVPPPPPPEDIIAPAAVSNLSAGSATDSSITLSWTAPGDDGNSGTASFYDIRFSSANITDANWSDATSITNAPTPQIAGTSQSVVVFGLSADTQYYFALKTSDEAGNVSALSNVPSAATLPKPADITPPVIDSILAKPQVSLVEISWHTNELADSQVAYGLANQLGQLSADSALTLNHKITLSNLTPDTVYYFKVISTDASGNQAVGLINGAQIGTFKTLNDTKPPANVSGFNAVAGDKKIGLSWQNPGDSDFVGVVIVRKTDGFPININDGSVFPMVAGASGQSASVIDDQGIANGTTYYYTAFAADQYGNYASGAIAQATPKAGEELPVVPEPTIPEEEKTLPPPVESGEEAAPAGEKAPGEAAPVAGEQETQGAGGGGSVQGLQLNDFDFTAAKGQIAVSASQQFAVLAGSGAGIILYDSKKPKEIESIILSIADSAYLFGFSEQKKIWQTEFMVPPAVGDYPAALTVKFTDQTSGVLKWNLQALPYGQIYEKKNGQKNALSGAKVFLYFQNQLWPAVSFYQNNPQITGADGIFGFTVPPGKYLLRIEKIGYSPEEIGINTGSFAINNSVELLYLPPKIKDVINPEATLTENISNVAQNLGEQAAFVSKKVLKEINQGARQAAETAKEIANNPEAQKTAKEVAAPVVAGAAVAGTAAVVGWAQLLGYLRFLFTQPFLLIKRRKRHGWGVVYNSLTKLPLDLVIVRLVDAVSGKIIQTRVTDSHGRYVFFPPTGSYRLETGVNQFKFPSAFLGAVKDDGAFLDLYHGEPVEVKEAGIAITANIPLDPLGSEPPLWKLVGRLAWRRLQHFFSILSLLLALVFAVWVPSALTIGLLTAQAVFYAIFLRLAIPQKPKSWGIIYDEKTRKPLARTVARIFDQQYNKLLETQVTDKTGRYSFLVGRNKYYVSYEKDGYEKKQSETIDLQNSSEPVASVGVDANLAKDNTTVDKVDENRLKK
ncbi:MAG: fibronectin type III domain-containing protein [Candidatus Magasanikbacteria bacterium]|nr:fibronectin type III domain-containing protein [Candidatus Magasanikbacteria bacterium]